MLALTLYAILPAVSLNLHKIGSRIKLWELNVYYFIIVFWELVAVALLFYLLRSNKIPLNAVGLSGGLSLGGVLYTIGGIVVGGLLYPVVQILIKSLGPAHCINLPNNSSKRAPSPLYGPIFRT